MHALTAPRKQYISFMLSPDWVANPALAEPDIARMADHGYFGAVLFIRHMSLTILDDSVRDAVAAIGARCRKHGVKFVLDTDWAHWGAHFANEHPQAAAGAVASCSVTVADGMFEVHAPYPTLAGMVVYDRLLAAFKPDGTGFAPVPGEDITHEWMSGTAQLSRPGVFLRGAVKDNYTGTLFCYVLFKTYGFPDVSHPDYLAAQKKMLDRFRGLPIDGLAWDEPGKGFSQLNFFKCGEGFLAKFRAACGYDLADRIVYLDRADGTSEAVTVRGDYYRLLNDMNYIAQFEHNEYGKQLFGKEIILGTHQTWSGFAADMATGCVDYFRHGGLLTEAWTDGGWSVEARDVAFNLALSDGLRHELDKPNAYYNDWSRLYPSAEEMRFANRHKMLYHVQNFLMDYSHFCEGHINHRFDHLRKQTKTEVAYLDGFSGLVGGRAAYADVAWLYDWTGGAAAPKWMTRAFFSFNKNLALCLADANLFPRIIGTESLRRAVPGGGDFHVGNLRYRVLVVPYAHVIARDLYDKAMVLAAAGVTVVFTGVPPQFDQMAKPLAEDFAERIGMKPFGISEYQARMAEKDKLPGVNEWEPEVMEFIYPVVPTTAQVTRDAEDRVFALKAAGSALWYLPAADPREDIVNLVAAHSRPFADTFCENTYLRFFGDTPDDCVVLVAAKGRTVDMPLTPDCVRLHARPVRKHREQKAMVRINGGELILRGGAWAAVRIINGKPDAVMGEGREVTWNGKSLL